MIDLLSEVRVAWRQWRRKPAMPLTIVLTLSAGIGAVIAVFAIAWAVLWRPLDVPEPGRLVWIEAQSKEGSGQSSPGAFAAWQAGARSLIEVAAIRPVSGVIGDAIGTDRVRGAMVTPSIVPLLALQPAVGQTFASDETQPGGTHVLLISHALWLGRYAGDASAVGRAITFNGSPATIIGVLPASASAIIGGAEWWSPLVLDARDRANTGPRYLDVIGRLGADVSLAAAHDELRAISTDLQLKQDDGSPLGVAVMPLAQHVAAGFTTSLQILLAGVVALLLIASTNVAVLLLTRSQDRAAELAIRSSVGATRGRIIRQLLIEAGTLTAVAVAGGLMLAMWLIDLLQFGLPANLPRLAEARIDAAVIAVAVGLGAVITLTIGLAPALRSGTVDLQSVMRSAATGVTGSDRLRRAFVIAQVAVAVVLTVAAGLLAQSARALDAAPRGYDASGVFTTSLTLPASSYRDTGSIAAVVSRVLADVSLIPGVSGVTASSQLPFAGGSAGADVALQDEVFTNGVDRQVRIRLVAPNYLKTLGGRLREGREVADTDTAASLPVVVVNRTLAARLAPQGSLVGRAVKFNVPVFGGPDGRRVYTVIGVADDTWDRGPRERVAPEVMLPIAQTPSEVFFWISRELHLAARSTVSPRALSAGIRRATARIDPAIPMSPGATLDDRVAAAFARERLVATLLSALGFAGVALALLGLGAVIDQQVRRQRRDIAIRVALGASRRGVVGMFVRSGAAMASAGVAIGAILSVAVAPTLSSLLFGIEPRDPRTIVAVGLLLTLVAILAAWLPARRAAGVDPAETLRA